LGDGGKFGRCNLRRREGVVSERSETAIWIEQDSVWSEYVNSGFGLTDDLIH
jgi:hypothetical protein